MYSCEPSSLSMENVMVAAELPGMPMLPTR